jgi:uncharacterized protein (DUF2141 family)
MNSVLGQVAFRGWRALALVGALIAPVSPASGFLALAVPTLALAVPASVSAQQAGTITVKVEGLKGGEGVALVVLYDSAESWLKVPKAAQVLRAKITGSALVVELKGVKPGSYAVSVIHDENKNNELDMRWLPYPKPKEGSGASRDPDAKVGPPKWDAAKFDVGAEGTTVQVTVKYP